MAPKTVNVSIESLQKTFYVRKQLNQDHVLHLAELYDNGVELPPIQATKTGIIIDGRHRVEALDMLGRKGVDVQYVEELDEAELIFRAMRANVGGSLPPNSADINYTIRQLLELNVTITKIADQLPFPASLVRRHITNVKTQLRREKQIKAVRDVTDKGMTVIEAANQYGVDPAAVKDIITGNRRKRASVAELKSGLTSAYRGRSRALANVFVSMRTKYENGELPASKVDEVFDHAESLHKQAAKTMKDWRDRFAALRRSVDR